MFDIFWNWQSFQADVPWLKILRFVDGCVCGFRGNSQICAGNSGNSASNVQNDSARTCSCVLVLLFILKAKTRLLLGLFMFRCFTLTACSALIELQDVTKTATNLWSFSRKCSPFIVFVTSLAGKNLCTFYFATLGFQVYIYIIIHIYRPSPHDSPPATSGTIAGCWVTCTGPTALTSMTSRAAGGRAPDWSVWGEGDGGMDYWKVNLIVL